MSLTPQKPDTQIQLPPAGTHRAVLYKLVNLGTLKTEWQGQEKWSHKIRLFWELSDETLEYEKDGEKHTGPFSVGRKFTFSMGDNSHLLPIVQGLIGQSLTEDEKWNFDIESLLGTPGLLTVIHDEYDGRKFAKVTSATTLPKGMEKPAQQNETVVLDVRKLTKEEIEALPEYIRNDMQQSKEYHLRFLAPRSENPQAESALPEYPEETPEIAPEDIPFN